MILDKSDKGEEAGIQGVDDYGKGCADDDADAVRCWMGNCLRK